MSGYTPDERSAYLTFPLSPLSIASSCPGA
jgi:hypothetical protein